MTNLKAWGKKNMPEPPPLRRLLGPSFILLGLGLGSGELILWPYLASTYGLGIIWGALLGITFQFFLNMEIERYTLVRGESIFVGLARRLGLLAPIWFIFSTLIPWMWPGIIAASATLLAHLLGIAYTPIVPIILLLLIGVILTLGPVVYRTQEVFQRTLVMIGVPLIFFLVLLFAKTPDWQALALGLVGKGEGFWFLPAGISLATFLGAFAYSGAGGNLNLAQSYYVKEKGFGMGKFSGRITSILTGKKEQIALEGTTFPLSPTNTKRFRIWWRRINLEHGMVFWVTGTLTMLALSLLAYATTHGKAETGASIGFVIAEGEIIAQATLPLLGKLFLLVAGLTLFSTQFSIMDATGRIMSENLVIFSPRRFQIKRLPLFYYSFLWLLILAGVTIFALGFTEPLGLVVIGATLNAFTMFVYSGLILWLNLTKLEKEIRPGWGRALILILACAFYGVFSSFVILQYLG
jgi:hypothetical protein